MTRLVDHEAEEDSQHWRSISVRRSHGRWSSPQRVDVVTRRDHFVALRVAEAATMSLKSSQESRDFRSNLPPIDPVALLAASK